MAEAEPEKRKMPKGGRKGGSRFPQLGLAKALEYSKKLVAKTHTAPLPAATILPGVFQNSGGIGNVRASALKQYGLLEGPSTAYQATKLAKEIDATPEPEKAALLQRAFLLPKIFNEIHQTFKGDTVSRSKIEQRARGLDVHPESSAECTQLFIESLVTAGLGTVDGDDVAINPSSVLSNVAEEEGRTDAESADTGEQQGPVADPMDGGDERKPPPAPLAPSVTPASPHGSARPSIAVNIDVDSSSDPEKLEKQLKLLRSFGLV